MMDDRQHLNQSINFALNRVETQGQSETPLNMARRMSGSRTMRERPAFCVLQRPRDGANSSLKKRLNLPLQLFATHQTHFACVNVISAAARLTEPDILNISVRWRIQAIEQQMHQVRTLRLWQPKYRLFYGGWVHAAMRSLNRHGFDVPVRVEG